jgi:hypothetical protein
MRRRLVTVGRRRLGYKRLKHRRVLRKEEDLPCFPSSTATARHQEG